jgi:pyrimidine nucleoside transport protein
LNGDDLFEDLPEPDPDQSLCGTGVFSRFGNVCQNWAAFQAKLGRLRTKHHSLEVKCFYGLIAILYNVYFFFALNSFLTAGSGRDLDWCNGFGLLILLTVVVYFGLFRRYVVRPFSNWFFSKKTGIQFRRKILEPIEGHYTSFMSLKFSSAIIYIVVVVAFVIFLIIDTADDRRRLMSAFGIVILVRSRILC